MNYLPCTHPVTLLPWFENRRNITMFSRSAQVSIPLCTQVRGMATLKEIRIRLKSVTNIQKITKSMKLVSAAKFAKAEKELKAARPYGEGSKAFYEHAEVQPEEGKEPAKMVMAISSDRGLCGAIHSSVVKAVKAMMLEPGNENTKLVVVGDKAKALLQKQYSKNFLVTVKETGRLPPSFEDASKIAQQVLDSEFKFEKLDIYYNQFKTVVSYKLTKVPAYSSDILQGSQVVQLYDSLDEELLNCYNEFTIANLVYFGMKEGACSEQSARMTAMDSASKNAGEMIDKLTLTFNRTRQAAITRELIEIISGASAL